MSSNDPVSEFLAREQSVLAELGEDFVASADRQATPQAAINNLEENGFHASDGNEFANGITDFMGSQHNSNANLEAFMNSEGSGVNQGHRTFSNSRSQSTQPEEEPEKIKKWREQQKELIEKKDKEEEKKKAELREQAKKELEQFYATRKSQLEQRKKQNRERQATFGTNPKLEENEANAHMWERVARMIEANAGGGGGVSIKTAKATGQTSTLGKDASRMKQLIMLYARGEPQNEKSPSPETA